MQIVDSGVIYDGASAPSYGRRSIRRTTVCRTSDGTIYVSFRRGTSHESIDGHPVTFASTDEGITWDFRYDGYGEGKLDDIPGQVIFSVGARSVFFLTRSSLKKRFFKKNAAKRRIFLKIIFKKKIAAKRRNF